MKELLLEKFSELERIDSGYVEAIMYLLETKLAFSEKNIDEIKTLSFDERSSTLVVNNMEYLILTDSEADKKAYSYLQMIIEDEGVENAFSNAFKREIAYYCMDVDKLAPIAKDLIAEEMTDLYHSSGISESDFIKELKAYDITIDFDDMINEYVERKTYNIDIVNYLLESYDNDIYRLLQEFKDYVDVDKVIDRVIKIEGRELALASYDSIEIDLPNKLFAYRVS